MHRESGRCIHPLRVAMLKVERVIGAIIGFAQRMNESGPFRRVRKLRKIISDILYIFNSVMISHAVSTNDHNKRQLGSDRRSFFRQLTT